MVLKVNKPLFTQSQRRVLMRLRKTSGEISGAVGRASFEFMNNVIGIASERAPLGKTGALRASGEVEEPVFEQGIVVVFAGFNLIYARMRDIGTRDLPGGVLRPVRAQALFIPLRDGAVPGDPSLEQGVDFVLATQVVQVGNNYWTGTLEEQMPQASRLVGRRAFAILKGATRGAGR